jgi:hypothetical protein
MMVLEIPDSPDQRRRRLKAAQSYLKTITTLRGGLKAAARERRRPPWDPERRALDLALEIDDRLELHKEEALKALIGHLVGEVGSPHFVTEVVTEGWRSIVTVSVTEEPA